MVLVAVAGIAAGACRLFLISQACRAKAQGHAVHEAGHTQGLVAMRIQVATAAWRVGIAERGLARLGRASRRDQSAEARGFQSAIQGWRSKEKAYRRFVEWHERGLAHHAMLRRKYGHAANHPWLPVAPDPPAPD